MLTAQFAGYYAVVWAAINVPFRFGLRTLLIATAIVAIGLGVLVWLFAPAL